MIFPLESLEMVSTINRWTPSLSLAGSIQTGCSDGYRSSIILQHHNKGQEAKEWDKNYC